MSNDRSMTEGEKILAKTVYTDAIDYKKVKIFNESWTFLQPTDRAMAPNGNIYYAKGNADYSRDFSAKKNIHKQATFIHELAHVWQHQKGVNVIVNGIFQRDYDYLPLTSKTKFYKLGIEEQAQLIRDYFYLLNGYHNAKWPPINIYRQVIPFVDVPVIGGPKP